MLFHIWTSEKYLSQPYICLHYIQYKDKLFFLVVFFCLLPFSANCIILICLLIATLFWISLQQYCFIYTCLLYIVFLIVVPVQNLISCDNYYILMFCSSFSTIGFSMTISLVLSEFSSSFKWNLQNRINLVIVSISVLYIRSYLILFSCLILHELILLTTKSQNIFSYYFTCLSYFLIQRWQQFLIMCLLAFQILNIYILKVQDLFFGMYLRYPDRLMTLQKYPIYILQYFFYILKLYLVFCSNDLPDYSQSVLANICLLDKASYIMPLCK